MRTEPLCELTLIIPPHHFVRFIFKRYMRDFHEIFPYQDEVLALD